MPNSWDTYEDGDGNVWAFDPPYDDEEHEIDLAIRDREQDDDRYRNEQR